MRYLRQTLMVLALIVTGYGVANAGISITVGKGDFYVSVGDYDYLPYGGYDRLPRVSFHDMMSDYGTWVNVAPFGRAWRPYVYFEWQPYTQGHWTYTRFGPTWVGYEPWAWVAYHYGNWIWSQYYGWVWLPGYDWHPGRVVWSYSYNTIGWMPAPPNGYNYFCGYLCPERYTYGYDPYRGSYGNSYPNQDYGDYNQYEDYNEYEDYNDYQDYGDYRDNSGYDQYQDRNYPYGGGYSDPYSAYGFRYEPYFFSPAYLRIAPRLWVFISVNNYGYDNYSDLYYGSDYVRYLFDRRLIQINRRGLDRYGLERVVRQRVVEQPVEIKTMETDRQQVRVITPIQEQEKIRAHANRVVKEVIAPAFVEKQKPFKAQSAKNKEVATRVFKQDPKRAPEVETLNEQTVLKEAKKSQEQRKVKQQEIVKRGIETIEKADREGKLEDMKKARDKAEQNEKQSKQKSVEPQDRSQERPDFPERNQQPQKDRDESMQKRSEQARPSGDDTEKFQNWKQRETQKFNAWKDRQVKEFENWKQSNQDKPQEVKKAEADLKERIRKAEDQFQQKTKRAEEEHGKKDKN